MPLDKQVSIHGITDIGEWTATKAATPTIEYDPTNVYVETSWGLTSQDGAKITPSVNTVKQRSGQSASVIDSFISEFDAQLGFTLLDAQLQTLKRLLGVPDSALTGDLGDLVPTAEVLVVKGSELGTEEKSLFVKCMGPLGPRTYYFPRAKVASLAEITHSRTAYFEPNATFDLYENDAGELFWIKDAEV